jgi:hypothetical protein
LPPVPCAFICTVAARAISQLCVTLASITAPKVSGGISSIFATLFMPEATTRMSRDPKASTVRATMSFADRVGRRAFVDLDHFGSEITAFLGDPGQRVCRPRRKHQFAARTGQHAGSDHAERARGAGDQRGLAGDLEHRERVCWIAHLSGSLAGRA